ncbi:MAG: sugar ABC transporter ATP-binding protein [Armatimonadetes bacterium]|nr:sugar ABC transporter ATP-binding protein [Armatimonadota bacterium]
MLEAKGIHKSYGQTRALINVSLQVRPGEVLALAGENGSGKSTMMRIISGEERPDTGELTLSEKPYVPRSPQDALAHGVSLVHQELALCPHMTVAENIFLGQMGLGGFSPKDAEAKAKPILEMLGYPNLDPRTEIRSLSISLQQVVEIARTQAINAEYVLLDEPTSSLTKADIHKLFDLVLRLKDQGKGIVYISHFLDELREIADRIAILRDGSMVYGSHMKDITEPEIIRHMVGREMNELFPRSTRVPGEPLLTVENLTGAGQKPNDASFTLHRGEVCGIAGLNGAGRTELLRAIFHLDSVKVGQITIGSNHPKSIQSSWLAGAGFLSEDRKEEGLALTMSIAENLTFPGRKGWTFSAKENDKIADEFAKKLRVKTRTVTQNIGELSGGNQQKVAIARLLHSGCDVLILDEPTRGIDIGSKAEIYELIDGLAKEGKAVLIVSSYLPELLGICDRVAVMSRGRLSDFVPVSETNQEKLMELCVVS